jgi:ferredoxin
MPGSGDKRMPYFQVNDKCNGCLACVQNCPADALDFKDINDCRTLSHNMTRCARCGNCWRVCPQDAVEFQYLMKSNWDDVITLTLIRCRICGDVLYPTNFEKTVSQKLDKTLELLCPRHRESINKMTQAHFHSGMNGSKEVPQ